MDKLDKTKDNIGVSKLDEGTKKDLFNKFVKAGGEVIEDKGKRKEVVIDSNKQRYTNKKSSIRKPTVRTDASAKKPAIKPQAVAQKPRIKTYPEHRETFVSRFFLRFLLWFHGIADLGGLYIKLKFLERFNNVYKPAMMELQMIYLDIFRKNLKTGNEISQRIDKIDPIYFELIEMISDMYDKMLTDQIVEHYINFPKIPKKVSELKEPLMRFYIKLQILRKYENLIIISFEKAIDIHQKLDQGKTGGISSMRRKVRNDVYILFNKFLPRLHWLFCYYENKNYDIFDTKIELILSIKDSDRPGNRKKYIIENENKQKDKEKEENKADVEEEVQLPEQIKQGLKMMYELNLATLKKDLEKYGLFSSAGENDKVLVAYLLFNEFDREYSFILNTNKIKYNVSFMKISSIDYKNELIKLYDEMRQCNESFKAYSEVLDGIDKAKHEKPIGNAQYVEFARRLEILTKKRIQAGRFSLKMVENFMEKTASVLNELIKDMNGPQSLIENPQDVIVFDELIEGIKKINNMKVFEAINTVFNYAGAFTYRLGGEGDLSGPIEFNANELNKPKPSQKPDEGNIEKNEDDKSVLSELDDMI